MVADYRAVFWRASDDARVDCARLVDAAARRWATVFVSNSDDVRIATALDAKAVVADYRGPFLVDVTALVSIALGWSLRRLGDGRPFP